ncbi:hypothetical protein ACEQ8H_006575 [Pleosporales sp. CAS-2024a]
MSADQGALKRIHALSTTLPPSPSPSPSQKRPRRERSRTTMSTADMYHFASTRAVVDLTSSPASSPPAAPAQARKPAPTMHATGGPRRLLVKNFRPTRRVDPHAFLDQTWAKTDSALATVFAQRPVDFSLEELYRGVEKLCRQGMAKHVKDRLVARCRAHVAGSLAAAVEESLARPSVDVLRATLHAWAVWTAQLKYLDCIFCYLDRAYLLPRHESLRAIATDLFRTLLFAHAQLRPRIVDGACDLVAADRAAAAALDSDMFSQTVAMFHDLHVYTTHFEPRLMELSQTFVMQWADREAERPLPEYVQSAKSLMDRELARVSTFGLPNTTRRDLLTLLEDHLISRKKSRLVNQDDLADLLQAHAVEHLELLYTLLQRRKLGATLRPAFVKWIEDEGTALVFNDKDQENMVIHLLTLKRQLDTVWKVSFHRDAELGHALREAFETFMNKTKKTTASWGTDNSKTGEMIAKYVDVLLRGGAKAIPASLSRRTERPAVAEAEDDNQDAMLDDDTQVNDQLDQVLDLFRFVHGKAVFEAFYKKDLARRLLMGRSASADAERSMLSKLKTECGAGFTANLEQMFRDIELSREEMASYKNISEERNERLSIDLNVSILSASSWPTYPTVPVIIPPQIKQAIDKFETHYKAKHSGRKLDFKHALAHCQVKAKFPKGSKELIVSSFQAIVLLLFNGLEPDEHMAYDYLKEATGLPPAELNRTLQSLACAKIRPLTKHPKGREINATDTFTLNASFDDPKYRIKINTVQLKETKEENKETHERVAADRNYETQAAIVRILKARKRIAHAELVAETIKATRSRGTLEVSGIKKNIDRLIEKEFLEREDDNAGWYAYIA